MNLGQIKNIIFHFGGVLIDIDYQRTYTALSTVLGIDMQYNKLPEITKKALDDFETGKINVETFIWNLQRMSKKDMPIGQDIIKAWNAMLIGWNPTKFELLKRLMGNYQLFLLSNTNELHLEWVYKDLKRNHKILHFDEEYFTKTYYSHKVGLKKPNKDIFEYVIQDAELSPNETLFIDDLLENVQAARSVGVHAYQHDPSEDLGSVLSNKLKLL